jgi:2-haloalkanoic acid dehalogenase type II
MLDFTRFEVLTFDCYGTLINWEAGILSALHRVLSAHGKKIADATILKLYGDFEQRSEQGTFRPYREVLESVVRQFAAEFRFTLSPDEARSLPDSLSTWKPWPDTVAALRQLKTRFRLAILSNVDDDLFAGTRPQLGVDFDEVITAQQAPGLQTFAETLRARPESHPRSCASRPARGPKHLPRCRSRSIARPRHRMGEPSLGPAGRRRRESRRGQSRSDCLKPRRARRRGHS